MLRQQQSNYLVRGEHWIMQQDYIEGKYFLQKKIPRIYKKKVAQLYFELELIQKLQLHMMLQPQTIEQDEQYVTMIYEVNEPYIPLTQLLGKPLQPTAFLKLAIQLTNCFIELHQVSHIYQNFHPQHVLVNKLNNSVKFINFEHTFKYSHQHGFIENEIEVPIHRVLYMAPEETGRVNSAIDFPTDLYSLGAIFYELLTGLPLFEGQDEILLHELLTKEPKSFTALGIEVPAVLEKIVFKLLSKHKEDRYQSAIGLKEDLTVCWYKLTNQIPLTDFKLGRNDEFGKWQLSKASPIAEQTLNQVIQHLHAGQKIQVVAGPMNSGKTFLLNQLEHNYATSFLFAPKVEGNTQDVPAVFLALRKQLQQLIQSNQLEALHGQSNLLSIIPNSILYFLPELRILQSQLKFSPEQEYLEQQQLFQMLVRLTDYFNVSTTPTLFLVDDYEQLDSFTQEFLQFVLTHYDDKQFIFSGKSERAFETILTGHPFSTVKMSLLTLEQIYAWLLKSLKNQGTAILQCSKLLYDLSNGISLYVDTLFNDICELQILKYDVHEQEWLYDVSKIHTLDLTNYDEFINGTLANLLNDERIVICYAICLGARFDVVQLFQIVPFEYAKTLQLFLQLVEKRILVILPEQFSMLELLVDLNMVQEFDMYAQFFNREMLERAKHMVSPVELQQAHEKIVDYLLQKPLTTTEQKRRLLHHLHLLADHLTAEQLHLYLSLSHELGQMTIKNALFHEALRFSIAFQEKMPYSYWNDHYQLALNGNILNANALYLNNRVEEATPLFEFVLQKAKTVEDKLFVYNETILFLTFSQVEFPVESHLRYIISLADEALQLVDLKLPKKYLMGQLIKEYALLKSTIFRQTDAQLMALPKITNRRIDLVLQIMMNVCGVALILDDKLFAWIIMRGLRLIHKFGDAVYGSFYYGGFSSLLSNAFQDFENAYRFGKLSIKHLEAYDNILFKGNVYMNYGGTTSHLKDPHHRSIYYLYQTQEHSIPNSLHDLYNATSAGYILIYMMLQGSQISDIKREYEEQYKYFAVTNNPIAVNFATELMQWLDVLQNESTRINWNYYVLYQTRISFYESHLLLRLEMSYLLCEQDESMKFIHLLDDVIKDSNIRPERPYYYFYKGLVLFKEMDRLNDKGKKMKYQREIKRCMRALHKYAKCGPDNFEHLHILLEALKYRYQNKSDKAMLYFDRAIQLASLANNPKLEAIAQLNAAHFYYAEGETEKASEYMQRALELLYRWGAPYAVNVLSDCYDYLLQQEQLIEQEGQTAQFQIAPIVNMYQTIAQVNDVSQLAKSALQEMLTQIDANEIFLVKVSKDKFYPIAYANNDDDSFQYYEDKQLSLPIGIDKSILEKVVNSKSYIVRNDAKAEKKSIIALSIFNQGQVTAIVYATNYVMASIFTKSKIDIVSILATQFLIALENIERQQQLELEVALRTEELSNLNAQLQEMNAHLIQGEQERKYFLQHISHDLRSPLTSVLGYVEAIQSGLVSSKEKQWQYLERSKIRLLSLQHLIKDLFDMTLLEGGRLQFQIKEIPLNQFVVLLEERIRDDLQTENINFESSCQMIEGEYIVNVDIERILQVIQNITSNILKYANQGTVQAHFLVTNGHITLMISDQGIGIPQKDLPFIFDMHYIASNHSSKESYGIGMAICKRIIELHNGHIEVTSTEGKGTTFTIHLPLHLD